MDDFKYTVIAVDGDFFDALEPDTNMLRFDNLRWSEATELCRLCFEQGFEIILWRAIESEEDTGEGGIDECGEEQTEAPIAN